MDFGEVGWCLGDSCLTRVIGLGEILDPVIIETEKDDIVKYYFPLAGWQQRTVLERTTWDPGTGSPRAVQKQVREGSPVLQTSSADPLL